MPVGRLLGEVEDDDAGGVDDVAPAVGDVVGCVGGAATGAASVNVACDGTPPSATPVTLYLPFFAQPVWLEHSASATWADQVSVTGVGASL